MAQERARADQLAASQEKMREEIADLNQRLRYHNQENDELSQQLASALAARQTSSVGVGLGGLPEAEGLRKEVMALSAQVRVLLGYAGLFFIVLIFWFLFYFAFFLRDGGPMTCRIPSTIRFGCWMTR